MPKGVYQRKRRETTPGCPLTRGEYECVQLLAEGLTCKQIAARRGVLDGTVRTLLHSAYRRLAVANRAQAVIRCEREGWLGSPPAQRTRSESVLEEIRTILEACLRQLEQGTRHRVTRSQYAYLQAFDAHLRRPGMDTDVAMGRALSAVLEDAHVIPSPSRRGPRKRRSAVPEAA